MTKTSVADIVTDRIIAALQTGVAPWRKPWATAASAWATNLISRKPYNGINQFLLQLSGYSSPYWLTYKQAAALGGNVRKGEKGTPVIYVGRAEDKKAKAKDGSAKSFTFLRYYTVFNVEQCENLGDHVPAVETARQPHQRIAAAEALVAGYVGAPRTQTADAAWYAPALDIIGIPSLDRFDTAEAYYATWFHEAIHSTGHQSRLNREGVAGDRLVAAFGSEVYGKEELVAELGAAFLCATAGIDNIPASAAYCKSWIKVLKGDSQLVISAASAAQKAYRYIHPETASAEETDAAEE